jgi:enoyl-[acyl-carrier-protein] reductase (NADH)
MQSLSGKKGLIIGIANEHSLAYGCAQHFRAAGADLAITYLNAKAEPFVRPLATALGCDIVMPCDVTVPGQLEAVPEHRLVTLDDVGAYAAFLVSDAARAITGNIAYVDAGYHVVA